MAGLPQGVSGAENGNVVVPPVNFGASGFNEALVDDKNPARHYVANLVAGFEAGPVVGTAIAVGRELPRICQGGCSFKDVRLGVVGVQHGAQLGGVNTPRMNLGLPVPTRRDVAGWIRRDL